MAMMDEARPEGEARGPTFEDLTLDDTLNDLERVEVYGDSHIALQRLVHVRLLAEVAETYGFEATRDRLLPLVDKRVSDEEFVVRQNLAEQLRGVARMLHEHGGDEGYSLIVERVLRSLARLVVDIQPEVRIAAGESLVTVAAMLKPADLGARLLTIVVHLAHNDEAEDMRMTAAVLLNELAVSLGPELCEQFVCSELEHLARDPVFRVRKATALNIDAVCRVVGPAVAAARLLPSFLLLADDDIWGVRKACAESLVCVSKALVPEVRVAKVLPLMQSFLRDASRWVRNSAYQHLGPFLATLPPAAITPAVLAPFIAMAPRVDPPRGTMPASTPPPDAELSIFCAFSFPAVAFTLGGARWDELRSLFLVLARHPEKKVRRPISYALHDIARVVGPDLTFRDLFPVFDLFCRDVDDVRRGVIRGMAPFLASLHPADREACVPVLRETLDSVPARGWRLRRLLARQMHSLARIFSPMMVFAQVRPVAESLLKDEVAAVRNAVAVRLAPLLETVGAASLVLREDIEASLLSGATSGNASTRLTLARALEALAAELPPEDFLGSFLATLKRLGRDPVPGVRRRVAALARRAAEAAASAKAAAAASDALKPAAPAAGSAVSTAGASAGASAAAGPASATSSPEAAAALAVCASEPSALGGSGGGGGGGKAGAIAVSGASEATTSSVRGADAVTMSTDDTAALFLIENPDRAPPTPALAYLADAPGMAELLAQLRRDADAEVRLAAGEEVVVGARRGAVGSDEGRGGPEHDEQGAASGAGSESMLAGESGEAPGVEGAPEVAVAPAVVGNPDDPDAFADAAFASGLPSSAAVAPAVSEAVPPIPPAVDGSA
ncbi:hypothetical protein FNF31_04069 [Cafeteria roenbergensis]|uniref:Phosphatase 2A Regulatory Subunit A helical domain-containing protein n=1 Tax=Cafeteria roenbergensis TaxID=33653 RepID=A0A5A8D6Y2_CAFRO|nr:hypothetical protein FNF31_04069 [Cafeteria roenbergensis]